MLTCIVVSPGRMSRASDAEELSMTSGASATAVEVEVDGVAIEEVLAGAASGAVAFFFLFEGGDCACA